MQPGDTLKEGQRMADYKHAYAGDESRMLSNQIDNRLAGLRQLINELRSGERQPTVIATVEALNQMLMVIEEMRQTQRGPM